MKRRSMEGKMSVPRSGEAAPVRHSKTVPLIIGAAAIALLYVARDVVILVVFSVLFAHVLAPLTNGLERVLKPLGHTQAVRRTVSLVVVLGVIFVLLWGLYLALPAVVRQLGSLSQEVPQYLDRVRELIERSARASEEGSLTSLWWKSLEAELGDATTAAASFLGSNMLGVLGQLFRIVGLFVIPFVSFYILYEGPKLKELLMEVVPPRNRARADELLSDIDLALSSYVRGQSVVCFMMMALAMLGFVVIGLSNGVALGVLVGLLEAVPFLGFIIAVLVIAIVGLAQAPVVALMAIIYYVVVNQIMSFTVTPRIFAHHMRLHPVVVVLALMAGAKLGGIVGILLSLPVTAVGKALLVNWAHAKRTSEPAHADDGKELGI